MRRRLLAVAAAAVLLVAGCGIPDDTGVTPVGPGPSEGPSIGDGGAAPLPNTRESAADKAQFVDYYLQAAAGDPEGAVDRVKEFLAPSIRSDFKPDDRAGVMVVRLAEKPLVNTDDITLTVQQVGTLQPSGVLEPAAEAKQFTYPLTVGTISGQDGLFITRPPTPNLLLLTDDALNYYYQRHTIYFWNTEYTGLVPDLRYMPASVPPEQQPTTILNWLANGSAQWLKPAVQLLPPGTTVPDNIPAITDDKLQVTLDTKLTQTDPVQLDRLRRQLLWSLRPLTPRTLELTIKNQDPETYTDSEYLNSNASYGLADVPERFVISDGQIRRLADSPHAADPVPVIKPEANRDIRSAALSNAGEHDFAAVVTGSGSAQALRVGVASVSSVTDLKPVIGLAGTLGHPAWAIATPGDTAAAIGLITVNGQVYGFGSDGRRAQPVKWRGAPGAVSSLSIAPDGHRVALVSGGRLYRCVITTGDDGIELSDAELVLPPVVRRVAEVAWSSEGWLVVAGIRPDGRYNVMDVTADGAVTNMRLEDIGTDAVSYLSAYPSNPVSTEEWATFESYVARGAWDVSGVPLQITLADLYGAKANDPKNNDARYAPTAPFFLN